jgi:uncharacterized metal-binding protein
MAAGGAHLPLVYACAGCSQAGRIAYETALELDRRGLAQMSCLAGLACGKKSFVRQAEGRALWIVDGCPIQCALGVLEHVGAVPQHHVRLDEFGVSKTAPLSAEFSVNSLVDAIQSAIVNERVA